MTPALACQDLRVALGGREVLHGVGLSLPAGRWTAVAGPNGAGKTTLLKSLARLLPAQGRITWLGREAATRGGRERARLLAWLGQDAGGAEDLRAHDIVRLGRLPHQARLAGPGDQDHQAVEEAMRRTGSWDWRERPLGQLSASSTRWRGRWRCRRRCC